MSSIIRQRLCDPPIQQLASKFRNTLKTSGCRNILAALQLNCVFCGRGRRFWLAKDPLFLAPSTALQKYPQTGTWVPLEVQSTVQKPTIQDCGGISFFAACFRICFSRIGSSHSFSAATRPPTNAHPPLVLSKCPLSRSLSQRDERNHPTSCECD
jgi:hypothetical protein